MSKVFERAILRAASSRSAVSSTIDGDVAGADAERRRAARVGRAHVRLRSGGDDQVRLAHQLDGRARLLTGAGSTCTRSRGAPMRSSSRVDEVEQQRAASSQPFGDGATITALRPFSALMILLAGVAPGLVDGVIAATTPTGRAISTSAARRVLAR